MNGQGSRTFFGVLAWALLCGGATARTLEFKTTQVTDADVVVSPDGKQLVFTILGHLFRVRVEGGDAEQLTFGACYDNDPVFAPDGRRIAFVSDRDGYIWEHRFGSVDHRAGSDEARADQGSIRNLSAPLVYVL